LIAIKARPDSLPNLPKAEAGGMISSDAKFEFISGQLFGQPSGNLSAHVAHVIG